MAMREEKLSLPATISQTIQPQEARAPSLPRQLNRETFMAGSFSRPGSRHGSTMQLNKEAPPAIPVSIVP